MPPPVFPTRISSVLSPPMQMHGLIRERADTGDGAHRAVIAVNDDVGDGRPIDLRAMSLDRYRANPVVLYAHDRYDGVPIGRSRRVEWTDRGLEAEFEFLPGDEFAGRVQNAWARGFLRAASIGASETGDGHELTEWSIVPVPADRDAVRAIVHTEEAEADMTEDKDRIDAIEARLAQLAEATESIMTMLGDAESGAEEHQPERLAEEHLSIEAAAERRADIIVLCRPLLPDGFATQGRSARDILAAAAGDEVENADARSEGYLLARVEAISERRAAAASTPLRAGRNGDAPITRPLTGIDIRRMREAADG